MKKKGRRGSSLRDVLRTTIRFIIFVVCALYVDTFEIKMDLERQAAEHANGQYHLKVDYGKTEYLPANKDPIEVPIDEVHKKIKPLFKEFSDYMSETIEKSISEVEVYCKDGTACPPETDTREGKGTDCDVRVSLEEGTYPYVVGPGGCGDPGHYIYLPYTLFDDSTEEQGNRHGANWKIFGANSDPGKARLLFSLWLMYRYGIPPDYGCYGHELFPQVVEAYTLDETGTRKDPEDDAHLLFNGCTESEPYKGKRVYEIKDCMNTLNREVSLHNILPVQDCRITELKEYLENPSPKRTTTMPWLTDKDDPADNKEQRMCNTKTHKHHYYTPLSFICPMRGQREIMEDHPDFETKVQARQQDQLNWKVVKLPDYQTYSGKPYVYISSFKNSIKGKASEYYAVLTYRAILSPGMVLLGAEVEAKASKKFSLSDDGCSPDPYPNDGYYSGVLPLKGMQGDMALSITFKPPRGGKASAMPNALSRPGPMVLEETEQSSRHTFCDLDDFTDTNDIWKMGEDPRMSAYKGYCIFFSESEKRLCEYEDVCESKAHGEEFELNHKFCKSKMKDSRTLIFRSVDEVERVNDFIKKGMGVEKPSYWVGGQRRTFCDGKNGNKNTNQAECTKQVEVESGIPDKKARASFRWAKQYDDQDEDPFPFTDREYPWNGGEPNALGPENHMNIGTGGAVEKFNDLTFKDENGKLQIGCRFKGMHDLFFATRSMQACNIKILAPHCPKNITALKPDDKETRIYACENKPSEFAPQEFDLTVVGETFRKRTFVERHLPLAGKIFRPKMVVETNQAANPKSTQLSFHFKAERIGEYQLACAENLDKLFKEETAIATYFKINKKKENVQLTKELTGTTTMVCSARKVDDKKKPVGHWSNVVSFALVGYCNRLDIHGDPNLILNKENVLLKKDEAVIIKCLKNDMVFKDRGKCGKVQLALTCDGKGYHDDQGIYYAKKEDLPTCKKYEVDSDCTEDCDCAKIPMIPNLGVTLTECSKDKNVCDLTEDAKKKNWIVHPSSKIVIKNECPTPPNLKNTEDIKTPPGSDPNDKYKHNDTITYTCKGGMKWNDRGESTLDAKCEFTRKPQPPGLEWIPSEAEGELTHHACQNTSLGDNCKDDKSCPQYAKCEDTCVCAAPTFKEVTLSSGLKVCHLTICTWSNVKDDTHGRYSIRAPLKEGETMKFTCDPGYVTEEYGREVEVKCMRRDDIDGIPMLAPPIYNLKCKEMKIGDSCENDDYCPTILGAECDNGKCICREPTKTNDAGNGCICDNVTCLDCDDNMNIDGDTKKCKEEKQHFSGETFQEMKLQCVNGVWRPESPTASSPENWVCQDIGPGSSCSKKDVDICGLGTNLVCDENTGTCNCKPGFKKKDGGQCEECQDNCKCDSDMDKPPALDQSPPGTVDGTIETGVSVSCKDDTEILPSLGLNELNYWCSIDDQGNPQWSFPNKNFFKEDDKCVKKPDEVGKSECDGFGDNANSICNMNLPLTECKKNEDGKMVCDCIEGTTISDDKKSCNPVHCKPQPEKGHVTVIQKGELDNLGIPNAPGTTITVSCPEGQVFQGSAVKNITLSCVNGTDGPEWSDNSLWPNSSSETFPSCVSSTDCRANGNADCDSETQTCNSSSWQCQCTEDYDMDLKDNYCIPKKCDDFEKLELTCAGKMNGENKRGYEVTCDCPKGMFVEGTYYRSQTLLCYHSQTERKNFWKTGGKIMRDDVKFQACTLPSSRSEMCKQVYEKRYGEVDEDGYPHDYSSLAMLMLGWSSGMTLVSVAAWAGIASYLWRGGFI